MSGRGSVPRSAVSHGWPPASVGTTSESRQREIYHLIVLRYKDATQNTDRRSFGCHINDANAQRTLFMIYQYQA